MFFSKALLLVSLYTATAKGLAIDFVPVPEEVWKAEGLDQAPPEPLIAASPGGGAANSAGWTVAVDSSQAGNPASNIIDGGDNRYKTFWHSQYTPMRYLPHFITIDTKQNRNIQGITYMPRQDGGKNGNIGQHRIYVSTDGVNFGDPVAFGTWYDDQTMKSAAWEPKTARYVRVVAVTEAGNRGPYSSAASIAVYVSPVGINNAKNIGAWGQTVNFPLVPVAAAVAPDSGNVMAWSSYTYDRFTQTPFGKTLTSVYNINAKTVSERLVTNTKHDMFCPGISYDATGRVIITGGNDAARVSIYTGGSENWQAGSNMYIQRGYQSQVTMGDGRIFVIGGSWSGGSGGKNGEIYQPKTNTWYRLPGAGVGVMLTADKRGIYRSDNHAWLFNWKGGWAFQAGPSKQMNWFNTNGNGGSSKAGNRGNDNHAMCGTATMYDATKGKILTTGGAANYDGTAATANAHIITLGNSNAAVNVQNINTMWHKRIFASATVLPDGKVLIAGGQAVGNPFSDGGSVYEPELWNPNNNGFQKLIPNSTPRTYHSWSLLLQDATVLIGGGGLCAGCSTNHFDAQVFVPPYLLNGNGGRVGRPGINSISAWKVKPGTTITVKTNAAVTSFSLIRYSTSTHTVNTDQRRIPMNPTGAGANTYKITLGPNDYGVVTPGYWMLFAINGAGVPSVSKTVLIV